MNRDRVLWKELPGYKEKDFKFLDFGKHCGNCANAILNGGKGCTPAKIISESNGEVVVFARCSGQQLKNKKDVVKENLRNYYKVNGKGKKNG